MEQGSSKERETHGEKLTRRLANPDLRCKNRCGFYGNPIYRGYCSKCYKEAEQGQQRSAVAEAPGPGSSSLFNRFNMKKRVQQTAKGRHGRLFKGGSPLRPNVEMPRIQVQKRSSRVVEPFNEFLKTLRKPAAHDIYNHLKSFQKTLVHDKVSHDTVDKLGEAVQEFYVSMAERLQTHTLFRNMTEEQQEDMMDGIEKHLMTNVYQYVFSIPSSDDEVKDLLLLRRIRTLSWLEPVHLDLALNLESEEVQAMVSKGREELWAMDSKKAPQDKLHCISKCSTYLMSALRHSQDSPASADDFLPVLIFMLIHSSPQHLHSNINYISRFSAPMRLMSGEAGYYFTNLCGAMSFIENLSADNLNMSEEEFQVCMGYVDGKSEADLFIQAEEEELQQSLEKLHVLKSCCQGMKELSSHLQLELVEARELEGKMDEFREGLKEQVASILATNLSTGTDLIDLGK